MEVYRLRERRRARRSLAVLHGSDNKRYVTITYHYVLSIRYYLADKTFTSHDTSYVFIEALDLH